MSSAAAHGFAMRPCRLLPRCCWFRLEAACGAARRQGDPAACSTLVSSAGPRNSRAAIGGRPFGQLVGKHHSAVAGPGRRLFQSGYQDLSWVQTPGMAWLTSATSKPNRL